MKTGKNTVLVTGGASGIGLAIAQRFARAGSKVILCGRRKEKLEEARRTNPEFEVRVCDIADPKQRIELRDWIISAHPELNVLVNNAGIQNRLSLASPDDWRRAEEELIINLHAPIHLSMLFAQHLASKRASVAPAILNVTSGLSFAPLANVPVYSATKAAFHSYTLSLRRQLKELGVAVIEVIPPAVDTDLGGPGLHKFGANVDAFADHVFRELENGASEISFGFSEKSSRASRAELDEIFNQMNSASR